VHDNDNKIRKLIQTMTPYGHPGLQEYLGPGHALKNLDRYIAKQKHRINMTERIADSLRRWMRTLIRNNSLTDDEKVAAWKNSVHHFKGNHAECPFQHKKDVPVLIDQDWPVDGLESFLEKTSWILKCCKPELSTQLNESFNRGKLKYATKDIRWGFSWEARMCCAIFDRNCPNWKLNMYGRLGLPPLGADVIRMIEAMERQRLMRKNLRMSEEYVAKKRAQKKDIKKWKNQAYRENPYIQIK
jgi:hypothetical protein